MADVSLLVKATRLCNLRCTYCYEWRTGPDQTMPFEVLARLIAEALRDPAHDSVRFTWHGGEPTLLGTEFYDRALWLQARFRRPGQVVTNALMTNGTRLDGEWLDFIVHHRIGITISLDGPQELHDRARLNVNGTGTFADVVAGMERMRARRVDFGTLMVVDRAALELGPDALFDFFVSLGVDSFGLNFVMPAAQPAAAPGTAVEHYVTPREKNAFLIRLYDRWLAHGDPYFRIRDLAAVQERVWDRPPLMCTLAGSCLGRIYAIEPDGDVTHCDYFLGDDAYVWGNVTRQSFADIRRSLRLSAARAARARDLEQLQDCPHIAVCQGGCPHERYASLRHDPDHNGSCCGMAPLIDHVKRASDVAVGIR